MTDKQEAPAEPVWTMVLVLEDEAGSAVTASGDIGGNLIKFVEQDADKVSEVLSACAAQLAKQLVAEFKQVIDLTS